MIAFLWFLEIIIGERVERRKKIKHFWLLSKTNFEVLRLGGGSGSRRGRLGHSGFVLSPLTLPLCQAGLSQGKVIYKNKISLVAGGSEQKHRLHLSYISLKNEIP